MTTTAAKKTRKPKAATITPDRGALLARLAALEAAVFGVTSSTSAGIRDQLARDLGALAADVRDSGMFAVRLDALVLTSARVGIAPKTSRKQRGHRNDEPLESATPPPPPPALVAPSPATSDDDDDDDGPATERGPAGEPGYASAGPPNGYRKWSTLRARVADFVDPVPAGRGEEPEDEEDARALIAFLEQSIGRLRSWLTHRHPVEGWDELVCFPSEKDPSTFTAFSGADHYVADPEGCGVANDDTDNYMRPLSSELAAERLEAERARITSATNGGGTR